MVLLCSEVLESGFEVSLYNRAREGGEQVNLVAEVTACQDGGRCTSSPLGGSMHVRLKDDTVPNDAGGSIRPAGFNLSRTKVKEFLRGQLV